MIPPGTAGAAGPDDPCRAAATQGRALAGPRVPSGRAFALRPAPVAGGTGTGLREPRHGRGCAFASFGEIVQGRRSNGVDFLLTLPVDLFTTCELDCEPWPGPSVIDGGLPKSVTVTRELLRALGLGTGVRVRLRFHREIPIGKGLSSSTADMLAVVRAVQDAFGLLIGEDFISRLFAAIEPHDGLHFDGCVAYDHRRGRLLARLGHVPRWQIVGVDAGGEVCTEEYNRHLRFPPDLMGEYDDLYDTVVSAFARRDDHAIARCAQRSARLHVRRTGNRFLAGLLAQADCPGVLGLLAAHSGTCGGFLLAARASPAEVERVARMAAGHGRVFRTRTLSLAG